MSALPIAEELRAALEYMLDAHYSDMGANTDEEVASFKATAYWMAKGALGRAAVELRAPNRMELSRAEAVKLEARLPVKQMLAEQRDVIGKRLITGVGVLAELADVSEDDRIKRPQMFRDLAIKFALLSYQAAAPLPTTDACICRSCKVVTLPAFGGGYDHCGRQWDHHRALNHHALPGGFWEKYRPGDKYTKALEGPLDGRGRLEMPGDIAS